MQTDTRRETADLAAAFTRTRRVTVELCEPLAVEDHVVQTMADVSPPKWHLAHTTWFFETFLLAPFVPGYRPVHPLYAVLFNSYYVSVGERHPRPQRGLLSRPTVAEILDYRRQVDARLLDLLEHGEESNREEVSRRLLLGLEHEQQHQELLLMDIKHILGSNPLFPVYRQAPQDGGLGRGGHALEWHDFDAGLQEFGHAGYGFAFDNEMPRHHAHLQPYSLASRLVTNEEYLAFIGEGGYERPELWLSDGWNTVVQQGWQAPLYWRQVEGDWFEFTLQGLVPLRGAAPLVHVSFFEAEAFARWKGCRLPTEFEWEHGARDLEVRGNFLETGHLQPQPAPSKAGLVQVYGDVWELTRSDYAPYPGYRQAKGAFGEYNGKFMSGQTVLRGGSCVTPQAHVRRTYRNFFYPAQRWCFQGLRLARDAGF
jgi:ergothioneine biosynthesis protein EgtB